MTLGMISRNLLETQYKLTDRWPLLWTDRPHWHGVGESFPKSTEASSGSCSWQGVGDQKLGGEEQAGVYTETRTWLSRGEQKARYFSGHIPLKESSVNCAERLSLCLLPQGIAEELQRQSNRGTPAPGLLFLGPLFLSPCCLLSPQEVPRLADFWLESAGGKHPQKSRGWEEEAEFFLPTL